MTKSKVNAHVILYHTYILKCSFLRGCTKSSLAYKMKKTHLRRIIPYYSLKESFTVRGFYSVCASKEAQLCNQRSTIMQKNKIHLLLSTTATILTNLHTFYRESLRLQIGIARVKITLFGKFHWI
jgi:hypothetical protein